jgi:hypothetical protein
MCLVALVNNVSTHGDASVDNYSTSYEDDGMPMRLSQDDDMHAIVKMRRVPSVLKGVRQCAC